MNTRNEEYFALELIFGQKTSVTEELKNKIVKVIEESKIEDDDAYQELPDFYNNFHNFAKIEGNSIKAECESKSNPDVEFILTETMLKARHLTEAFKEMKIGLKLYISYMSVAYENESWFKKYHVGVCASGEYKKILEDEVNTMSFRWRDEDFDGYFTRYTIPGLDE